MMKNAMDEAYQRVAEAAEKAENTQESSQSRRCGSPSRVDRDERARRENEERARRQARARVERHTEKESPRATSYEQRRQANIKRVAEELHSKSREEAVYNMMKDEVDRKVKEQRDKQRSKDKVEANSRKKHEEELKSRRETEWAKLQADRKKKAADEQARRERESAKKSQQQQQHRNASYSKGSTGKSSKPDAPRGSSPVKTTGSHGTDDSRWLDFESLTSSNITMRDIPFPDANSKRYSNCDKKVFQKLAMRWHPDKFLQRFGNRLGDRDKDRVMLKVKEVFQAISSKRA